MASMPSVPTYFLAPNCDFPPNGLIALGSIIVNPKTPQKSLNQRNNQRIAVPADDLQESFKENWEDVIKSARQHRVTLWTSFLQTVLGIGADVSGGIKKGREDTFKFRRLETKFFEPAMAYIEESLKAEGVRAYLSASGHKKPIYMVTGVKVAYGASVTSKTVKGYDGMFDAGLNATMLTGIPVSAGPQIESSRSKEREVKFESGSDYVFAYRVVKIQLGKKGEVKRQDDFNKGAVFSIDESGGGNEDLVARDWNVEELVATSGELQGNNKVVFEVICEDGEDVVVVAR